ncbi:MAG: hypothetical protein V7L11_05900 [Nostoc sp.]
MVLINSALGTGDWGLGIGDWVWGLIISPSSSSSSSSFPRPY